MPGIAGIIRRQPYEGIDGDFGLMVESMRHESHYVGGRYVNKDIGLYVGWLSHRGTLGDGMPMMSHDKRVVLIIVGEHFPPSHSQGLADRGDSLDGARQKLLSLYQKSEKEFLN